MIGFGYFFIIFGIVTFLYGIFICAGHSPYIKRGEVIQKLDLPKEKLKYLGTVVAFISLPIVLCGISALFYEEENIIPVFILISLEILTIVVLVSNRKKHK